MWILMDIVFAFTIIGTTLFMAIGERLKMQDNVIYRFISMMWNRLNLVIWWPSIQKYLYIVITYMTIKRLLFYTLTSIASTPYWFVLAEVTLPPLPGAPLSFASWLVLTVIVLLMEAIAWTRQTKNKMLNPVWVPLLYLAIAWRTTLLIFQRF